MTDTSTLRERIVALKHPGMPARNAALDDVLAILDAQTVKPDFQLSAQKVGSATQDQTGVSSSAAPTDNTALVEALDVCLEWIDAVPSDTPLPAMPGFDRDWVDNIRNRAALASREAKPAPDAAAEAWAGPGESPHEYRPDLMAMGDCAICGHVYAAHLPAKEPRT